MNQFRAILLFFRIESLGHYQLFVTRVIVNVVETP